ncbi:MAG: hypothetical protein AAGG38_14135 [Planctomycetota bacterium]
MTQSVQEIKAAIEQLTENQRWELFTWQQQHFDDDWDRRMREDSQAGKLDHLVDQALRDHREGRTTEW